MLQRNPVLQKELITRLTSWRSFLGLFFFVGTLAFCIYNAWPEPRATLAPEVIAKHLFSVFFRIQMILIVLTTPAMAATAFTLEKERGNFDLLLTTPLSAWKLVTGKFTSALTYILLLLICSLPVMVICFLLGGISIGELSVNYFFMAGTAFACCSVSLLISTKSERSTSALGLSYLTCVCVGLVLEVIRGGTQGEVGGVFALMVVGFVVIPVSFSFLQSAASAVAARTEYIPKTLAKEEKEQQEGVLQLDRSKFPDRFILPPRREGLLPDGTNPMLDKEFRCEIYGRGTATIRKIIFFSAIVTIFFIPFSYDETRAVYFLFFLMAFASVIAPAFSASCLTQEKERNTLVMLKTTLLTYRQILFGKYWVALRMPLILVSLLTIPLGIAIVFRLLLAVQLKRWDSLDFLLMQGPILFMTLITASLTGLLCSAIFKRTITAVCISYLAVFLLFLGVPVVASLAAHYDNLPNTEVLQLSSPFSLALYALGSRSPLRASRSSIDPWYGLLIMGANCGIMFLLSAILFRRSWAKAGV